jgi:energy-coupling factor transporter ATP-binding protein EcfA2
VKFERLHVAGFGRLEDMQIEFGNGLTVVAGPNEAGKSTIVECLLRLLFGFPETQHNKARKRYEPWRPGALYGATLFYRLDNGRTYGVVRDFAKPDVPTETFEADTRRPVPALSGNKSASPGEEALSLSLEVYKAAAVVSAGDFAETPNGANHALADRLAAIIGAAGEASAAQAIERLKEAYTDIGLSGANTPLGAATREAEQAETALRRFRADQSGLDDNLRRQAELADRVHDLKMRRTSCAAALAAVRLRSVRARITEAGDAQKELSAATARREAVVSASPAALARRDDVDSAAEALRLADQAAADASARAAAREAGRGALQRDVDGASAALLEKRALVTRLDETIAAHERASTGRPAITTDQLAQLEREADEADVAESRARTLDTMAAIARQRSRPQIAPALVAFLAFAASTAAWFFTQITAVGIAAIFFALLAGVFVAAFAKGARKRSEAIGAAEAAVIDAAEESARAVFALDARCRAVGCANVAAVRAARTAQVELDRVRAERGAASEAATLLVAQRDALARRLDDVKELEADRVSTRNRADERRSALTSLLDEIGIAPGPIDDRLSAYRRLLDAGEGSARADAAVASARTALERALRGKTVESLEDDAVRYAAEAAAGGDPSEFADRTETDLDQELDMLDAQYREAELMLGDALARVSEFDRLHPVASSELEERAAAATRERDRLRAIRASLEIASDVIEEVKDAVHRDFTPYLNEAVGKSVAAITGGRYRQAWIDQGDFTVRVRVPETGGSHEADALSTGTIEQFQFALRAALASALGNGEHVPILYDDALAHADDGRLRAALERAAELARDGEQIVFFTQRGDVEELAMHLTDVRVVRLAGPAA